MELHQIHSMAIYSRGLLKRIFGLAAECGLVECARDCISRILEALQCLRRQKLNRSDADRNDQREHDGIFDCGWSVFLLKELDDCLLVETIEHRSGHLRWRGCLGVEQYSLVNRSLFLTDRSSYPLGLFTYPNGILFLCTTGGWLAGD